MANDDSIGASGLTTERGLARPLARPGFQPPRILLVTEDDALSLALAGWLTQRGCETRRVGSGHQALRCWHELAPDAVLVDLDDDELEALELLTAVQDFEPRGRAVLCCRRPTAVLPPAIWPRLGVCAVVVGPHRLDTIGAALEQALATSEREHEA